MTAETPRFVQSPEGRPPRENPHAWMGLQERSSDPEIARQQTKVALGIEAVLQQIPGFKKAWFGKEFTGEAKEDASRVLDLDKAIETKISTSLTAHPEFNGDHFWGEEGMTGEREAVPPSGERVSIDPIDGTRGAEDGDINASICIGFATEDGKPLGGVLAVPAANLVYYGVVGVGAFVHSLDQDIPVEARTRKLEPRTQKSKTIEFSNSTKDGKDKEISQTSTFWTSLGYALKDDGLTQNKVPGIQLPMVQTVDGAKRATISVRRADKPMEEFDAAIGIVTAAGGEVVHVDTGNNERVVISGYPENVEEEIRRILKVMSYTVSPEKRYAFYNGLPDKYKEHFIELMPQQV